MIPITLPFPLTDSLLMFYIYGFIGWIVEVCYYGITEGKFINRGFLNGPLCPVYGIGFYGVIWFFQPFLDSFPMLFFGSAIVCTMVELLAGVILYAIFRLRWWDYSNYRLNFHGFICVRFSIYWGIACSLGMYMLHPAVMHLIFNIPKYVKYAVLGCFTTLMVIDIIVTVTAIVGFNKKVRLLAEISGGIRKYSDKIGSSIYGTVDTIKTKTAPAVEMTTADYTQFREVYTGNRKEERELYRKHREQERELLAKYVKEGRQGITKTSKEAFNSVKLLLPEMKLASRIRFGKNDENAETIRMLKAHYSDISGEEIPETYEGGEDFYEDNSGI